MRTTVRGMTIATLTVIAVVCALVVLTADSSFAEGGPPATGYWVVTGEYILENTVAVLKGNLIVEAGGNLTVRNCTIMVMCSYPGEYGLLVRSGGALQVLDGSVLMPSRPYIQWTWTAAAGSRLVLRDSTVKWCGVPPVSGLTVNTPDAIVERCRFEDGFIGLNFPSATPAAPIRNCTFDTFYGVVTRRTDVEDCQFGGTTYYGIDVLYSWEGGVSISRCTFDGMRATCIDASGSPGGPIIDCSIIECSFRDSPRGILAEKAYNLTVERCTFNGTFQEAIKLADCSVHLVDGTFTNLSQAFFLGGSSFLDWTVREEAEVTGAAVMISGDLVLASGATMRLRGCGSLSMLSGPDAPLSIVLGEGSVLELINTDLEVPTDWWGVRYGVPVRIVGGGATLELNGVDRLDVEFPVELGELRCFDSVLALGSWNLSTVHLEGCTLVPDPRGGRSVLVISGDGCSTAIGRAGEFVACVLDGIPDTGASNATWLDIRAGLLRSVDSLWGLEALVSAGEVRLPEEEGLAMLVAAFTVRVEVRWRNALPVQGAVARVIDRTMTEIVATTDEEGFVPLDALTTEVATSASCMRCLFPFEIDVDAHGIPSNVTVPSVTAPTIIAVVLTDDRAPLLTVDQGDFIGTRSPDLNVSGRALDLECGIAYLELIAELQASVTVPVRIDGTFELALHVRPGFQTILLRLFDQSGNRAERSLTIFHSARPPRIFSVEPESGTLVNTTHVMLTGDTEPNVEVEAAGRSQLTTSGTFKMLVPVVEGENRLTVNFTDLAGNRNSTTVRVVRDTVPPDLAITTPARSPLLTREQRGVIGGRTEPGAIVLVNAVMFLTDASGVFTATVSLGEDDNAFTVSASDAAGNSRTTEVVFVLDTLPPSLRVLWPPEGGLMTKERSVVLQLEVDADATLTLNDAPLALTGSPTSVRLDLAEGENVLVLRASDALGNACEVTRVVSSRATPPGLTLDPWPPTVTSNPLLKLAGRTEPGAKLEVNGLVLPVDGEGRFTLALLLANGTTHLVVVVTDGYGNVANASCDVTLTNPPQDVRGPRPTLLPTLLLATAAILVVEGAVRALLARRRSKGSANGPPGEPDRRG